MKNQREIYEALLKGKTLVLRYDRSCAYLDDDGNLNQPWTFSNPNEWTIETTKRKVELFECLVDDGGEQNELRWLNQEHIDWKTQLEYGVIKLGPSRIVEVPE